MTGALSYHHDRDDPISLSLLPDEVEVHVGAIGLTTSDGADDAHVLSHQFAGTVVRAGDKAEVQFPPGSLVAGFASGFNGRIATFQRTSSHLIFSLDETGHNLQRVLAEAATIPSAFSTAMYGIEELARVEAGNNVLIVDGMGAVGLAAVQVCQIIGARVIIVTSSDFTK